ncbi:hypothetical protein MMC09_000343 [Bachmanniomyces sp. S44760]|nr:hypothetical protein [Bachmanniomyces sp. S44760]
MPGRKGRLTSHKLAKEELEDEKVNNPKSYQKIINNWAIRNPALQINVKNFNIETNYKYTPKKIQQAAGYALTNKAKKKAGEIKDDKSEPEEEDNYEEKPNKKMAGKRLPKLKIMTEQTDNPFSEDALGIGKGISVDEDNPFQNIVQKTQEPGSDQDNDEEPYTSAALLKTPKKKTKNVILSKRKPESDDEDKVAFLKNFEK